MNKAVIYLRIAMLPESRVRYAAHVIVGSDTDKPVTASKGNVFTDQGYLTRTQFTDFSKRAEKLNSVDDGVEVYDGDEDSDESENVQIPLIDMLVDEFELHTGAVVKDEFMDGMNLLTPLSLEDYAGVMEVPLEEHDPCSATYKLLTLINLKLKEYEVGQILFMSEHTRVATRINSTLRDLKMRGWRTPSGTAIPGKKYLAELETSGVEVIARKYDPAFQHLGQAQAGILLHLAEGTEEPTYLKYTYDKPALFSGYWKSPFERNPLMSFKYTIFDSIALRENYYQFDDKDIYDFGKRTGTVAYAVIAPKERDLYIDALIKKNLKDRLEPAIFHLTNLVAFNPIVASSVVKYGTKLLTGAISAIFPFSGQEVYGEYSPPGLSMRGIDYLKNLEVILNKYRKGDMEDGLNPQEDFSDIMLSDVTSFLYEPDEKGALKIRKDIPLNSKMVKMTTPGAGKATAWYLFGKDLPSRGALSKLGPDVKVKVFSLKHINIVRYGIIIECDSGTAIYSNWNCNVKIATLTSPEQNKNAKL